MSAFTQEEKAYFMREALKEAQKSLAKGEIPIGCVIVKDGEIIGRGHNAREEQQKAILHAEIMAINEANEKEGNWRLLDSTLFVTIEPRSEEHTLNSSHVSISYAVFCLKKKILYQA